MDYGERINLIKYRSKRPPAYNLSKVKAPVILYYGDADIIITKEVK